MTVPSNRALIEDLRNSVNFQRTFEIIDTYEETEALESALEDAGIAIPVIIRTDTVVEHAKPANSIEELWEIPEE